MQTLDQLRRGELAGATRLRLSCGLREFPREIFTLADTLEILDLSGNALTSLPDDLPRLHKLRIVFCSDNPFETLPAVLGQCPNLSMIGFKANRIRHVPPQSLPLRLRWLILTDNCIETLPDELGHCTHLQKLMLAGNRLRQLPSTLANCRQLELLRIAANNLDELPDWLLHMPRLAWLAFAGNPFAISPELSCSAAAGIPDIRWSQLTIQERLGEGASGVIYRAEDRSPGSPRAVAVKLFKGQVTSDGLPDCEMAACIAAGEHANLIPVLGKLQAHPEKTHGLILGLIDPTFRNLAGPPSLDSCTRDVYPPNTRLSASTATSIARGIASAAWQLHQQGIMHGDLYAHNILHCGQGRALLGDFGAASIFPLDQKILADRLQRIEIRAFGCLLEELIAHCDPDSPPGVQRDRLSALKAACLQTNVLGRPNFETVTQSLARQ
nr:protein kinase [Dechloromonas sp.]